MSASGLSHIASPSAKKVSVNGTDVDVCGVSFEGAVALLGSFPELMAMFRGRVVDAGTIIASGPKLVAAVLAAGTGAPGDAEAMDIASKLPIGTQLDLLEAIIAVTMPDGLPAFVTRLTRLIDSMGNAAGPASVPSIGKRKH
jgi:hypothetical protein